MKKIHSQSHECSKSEIDWFNVGPTQTVLKQKKYIEKNPVSTLTDNGPVEFYIPGSSDNYIDMSGILLYVRCKITKEDGTALDVGAKVGPVNLFLHSLFSQVNVLMNEKLISGSSNTYPYKTYLQTLLSHGSGIKTSELTSSLFYKDTAGHMDSADPTAGSSANIGLKSRYQFTKESHSVDMIGKLNVDMFNQDRLLINGVDLRIRLTRSKNEFCLMSSEASPKYKVVLEEACLRVPQVEPTPSILLMNEAMIRKTTVKYPITRIETKTYTVPVNNTTGNQDNVFMGQIPNRVCLAMVKNEALSGSYTANPFNFEHFDLSFISLNVNGQSVPGNPIKPDYSITHGQNFIKAFYNLFESIDSVKISDGNQISRSDFATGYAIYVFDLSPDQAQAEHFNAIKNGTVSVEIVFNKPLSKTVSIIALAEFSNLIEVDESRNILFDYSI